MAGKKQGAYVITLSVTNTQNHGKMATVLEWFSKLAPDWFT